MQGPKLLADPSCQERVRQADKIRYAQLFGPGRLADAQLVQNFFHGFLGILLLAVKSLEVIPQALAPVGKTAADQAVEVLIILGLILLVLPLLEHHDS